MSTRKLLLLCLATALSGACSLDGASSPPELALTTKPIANMSTTGYQRTTIQLSAQQSADVLDRLAAEHPDLDARLASLSYGQCWVFGGTLSLTVAAQSYVCKSFGICGDADGDGADWLVEARGCQPVLQRVSNTTEVTQ